jgi:hypothetical protein
MEAVRTSETSVPFNVTTRQYIPEDNSEHHTRRRENLKSHKYWGYSNNWLYGSRTRWPRGLRRRSAAAWLLGSLVRIPLRAWMFVSCVYMLSCVGREAFATGWSLVQRSPTVCLNKITKPPVWDGQGPYKDCRATDDDDDDDGYIATMVGRLCMKQLNV